MTDNPSDFGDTDLLPYDIYTADEFLCLVDDGAPANVRAVTQEQNAYWQTRKNDGRHAKGLVEALIDAGCPDFATRVRRHLRVLSGPTS